MYDSQFSGEIHLRKLSVILQHTDSGGRVYLAVTYKRIHINPLTAGAAYIRVFSFYKHIKYHLLNMLKIKCDINQQYE